MDNVFVIAIASSDPIVLGSKRRVQWLRKRTRVNDALYGDRLLRAPAGYWRHAAQLRDAAVPAEAT